METDTEIVENVTELAEKTAVEVTTAASAHANGILQKIDSLTITTQEHCIQCGDLLRTVKKAYTKLEAIRKDTVKPINDAKAKIQGLFKPDLDKYQKAERLLKSAIGVYQAEQEKIRQAEQEKIRLKVAKEEEKRKKILAEQAERAAKKGDLERAESLQEQAETFHKPVPIIPVAHKVQGISYSTTWKAKPAGGASGYDMELLPIEFHLPNQKMLDAQAKATNKLRPVPGVEFFEHKTMNVR